MIKAPSIQSIIISLKASSFEFLKIDSAGSCAIILIMNLLLFCNVGKSAIISFADAASRAVINNFLIRVSQSWIY